MLNLDAMFPQEKPDYGKAPEGSSYASCVLSETERKIFCEGKLAIMRVKPDQYFVNVQALNEFDWWKNCGIRMGAQVAFVDEALPRTKERLDYLKLERISHHQGEHATIFQSADGTFPLKFTVSSRWDGADVVTDVGPWDHYKTCGWLDSRKIIQIYGVYTSDPNSTERLDYYVNMTDFVFQLGVQAKISHELIHGRIDDLPRIPDAKFIRVWSNPVARGQCRFTGALNGSQFDFLVSMDTDRVLGVSGWNAQFAIRTMLMMDSPTERIVDNPQKVPIAKPQTVNSQADREIAQPQKVPTNVLETVLKNIGFVQADLDAIYRKSLIAQVLQKKAERSAELRGFNLVV